LYNPQARKRLRRDASILTASLALLLCAAERAGSLDWLENRSSDWRVNATLDPSKADPDIVIIDIDNNTFQSLTDALGRWPWTRQIWTQVLNYIAPGKPKLILFDILFPGEEPKVDPGFAAAIRSAGNVILPFAFTSTGIDTESKTLPPGLAMVAIRSQIPGAELKPSEWSLNLPHKPLAAAMAGSGSILSIPDSDGITRRLPLVTRYKGVAWASHWLAAAMMLRGANNAEFHNGQFQAGPIRLPVDAQGAYVIRWRGTPITAYKRIPLGDIVCSMQPEVCDDAGVTRHPASAFKDKIVYIGASAAGSYEVRPTPVAETAPGVFVLATALDNLLHNDAVRRMPWWLTIALILFMGALPAWSVTASRSIAAPLAVTGGALAVYGGACFALYGRGIWMPMSAPMLSAFVSFTANTALRYLTVDRELSRTRGTLERYVSPQLVRYVMDHIESFRFDGEKRKLTIFFSDVRSFTTLTEKSDPVRLLRQLNQYLEAMTDIIFQYDGIVDKFIGDGIMAHWGAFTPDKPNAHLAARAALDMMQKLAELNRQWEVDGYPPLDIGIGLNTAEVIFGNVGTGKKLDFTCIGDGVNLAARLESANKEYKTHIIISDTTRHELGDAAQVHSLGTIVVKGKTVGVEIFELKAVAT